MKNLDLIALTKAIALSIFIFWCWTMLCCIFTMHFPGMWFHMSLGFIECTCAAIGIYHEEKA